jgi:putative endonuclease
MSFYAYVLVSEEFYHYTGHTSDLDLRIARHHLKTTHFTKRGTNWRIIYSKEFATRAEAMKHEKWLKSGVGREWLKANIAGHIKSPEESPFK